MKKFKFFWTLLLILLIEINLTEAKKSKKSKSKKKSRKKNTSSNPDASVKLESQASQIRRAHVIYDSERDEGRPFSKRSHLSDYIQNKQTRAVMKKFYKNVDIRKHLVQILDVIAIYSLLNEEKILMRPRYLSLASKQLKSDMLEKTVDQITQTSLFKDDFYKMVDDIYTLKKEDFRKARKLNLFDNSKKRKDRLKELDMHLDKSLKRKTRDPPNAKAKIDIDRKLSEQSPIFSIENKIYDRTHKGLKEENSPVERSLLQERSFRTKPKRKQSSRRSSRSRKNSRKVRYLKTELINPVHKRRRRKRKMFSMPSIPGAGGGVTQGAGVENLKVVINAIGQPSTYLPIEQNDSYKKGYNEQDAAPKVIVTRMQLPSRIGKV